MSVAVTPWKDLDRRGWRGDPAAEEEFLRYRFQENGRSLAAAATAVAFIWLVFIPIELLSEGSLAARATAVGARSAAGLALLVVAAALWNHAAWLPTAAGRRILTAVAVVTAGSFLVMTATRAGGSGSLDVSATLLGMAVLLFVPVPLVHRILVVGAFYPAFVTVVAVRAIDAVGDPGYLALNMAAAAFCAAICGWHLDRSARRAYGLVRHVSQVNDRLSEEIESGEALRAVLSRQAAEDGLTGLLNRRTFYELAGDRAASGDERNQASCVVVVDADRFKGINDSHGHGVGDEVLAGLAHTLSTAVRDGDLVGRLGGEEFCIFLPHAEVAAAMAVADRVRASVAAQRFETRAGLIGLTVSVGVAERVGGEPLDETLRRADAAMYESKRAGGDRLHCHRPAELTHLAR